MNPWDAVRLTPFRALQAIVAERFGADSARALQDYSSVARHGLRYLENGSFIVSAFAVAEKDLSAWCAQGLVKARGFRVIGHFGQLAGDPEPLDDWWSDTRHLDFEAGFLRGNPVFKTVELLRADIIQLVRNIPQPRATPSWVPAMPPSGKSAPQAERAGRVLLKLYPDGPPPAVELRDDDLEHFPLTPVHTLRL